MTKGIAHVSFPGGGMFVPARNPYDRQLLAEHVLSRARAKGQVQVLLDDQRWMVYHSPGRRNICCSRCGVAVDSACYLGPATSAISMARSPWSLQASKADMLLVPTEGTPHCVSCAFEQRTARPGHLRPVAERRAS
jgi:hypothetical protein